MSIDDLQREHKKLQRENQQNKRVVDKLRSENSKLFDESRGYKRKFEEVEAELKSLWGDLNTEQDSSNWSTKAAGKHTSAAGSTAAGKPPE